MLIPFLAYVFIQAVLALVVVACVAIIKIRRRRRDPIAIARIDRPARRFIARIAPAFAILVALAGMWQLHTHATDVLVINPDLRETRAVYLGRTDYYASLPRTVQLDGEVPSDPTWIVNASNRTIQVVPSYYGPENPRFLGPGELGVSFSVDYFGPDDRPGIEEAHRPLFRNEKDHETWVTW